MAKLITLNDLTRFVTNIKNLIKNERTSIENKLTGYVPKKVHKTKYQIYCQRPSGATIDPGGIQMIPYSSTILETTIAYRAKDGVLRGKTAPLANQEGKDLINREELTEKLGEVGGGLKWVDYSAEIPRRNVYALCIGLVYFSIGRGIHYLLPVIGTCGDNSVGVKHHYERFLATHCVGGKGAYSLQKQGDGYAEQVILSDQILADGATAEWDTGDIMKMLVKE